MVFLEMQHFLKRHTPNAKIQLLSKLLAHAHKHSISKPRIASKICKSIDVYHTSTSFFGTGIRLWLGRKETFVDCDARLRSHLGTEEPGTEVEVLSRCFTKLVVTSYDD